MGHGPLGTDKDIEKLARSARRQGWSVEVTRNNHVRWLPPDPEAEIVIGALSTGRTGVNALKRQLKKAGLQV